MPIGSWRGNRGFYPSLPAGFPEAEDGVTTCPGYLTTLPEVIEGARALAWAKRGSLSDLYEEPLTDLVRDAVDVVAAAAGAVEAHAGRESRRQANRKGR